MTVASEGGHWYTQAGVPCYELPNKSKPGEMRPTTKTDARKLNLSPSVSGVAGTLAAPALERWKRTQLLLCSAELRRDPLEGDQAWMDRVTALYSERTTSARDLGTLVHGCIEKHLAGERYDQTYAKHVQAALAEFDQWCGLDGLRSEKSFAHPLGYGGKCDAHKEGFVSDFKTKEFGKGDLPSIYDNHKIQLAAYREGLGMSSARCAIIYVSTSVPGLTHLVELSEEALDRGWRIFERLVDTWQVVNNYKPKTELTQQDEEVFVV
jgi:hypothetical protein